MTALSDAPFYAPLKTSLVLQNGSGNPIITRATIARLFDNTNTLVPVPSGAARFAGARCVVNLVDKSEGVFSNALRASSVTGNTDVPAGYGFTTSTKLMEDSTAGASHYGNRFITVLDTGSYVVRQYFKAAGRSSVNIYGSGSFNFTSGSSAVVDLITGVVTGTASGSVTATLLANGWVQVVSTHVATTTVAAHLLYTELRSGGSSTYNGDGTSGVLSTGVMCVRGATAPSEYVSVGVLSSPYYGAGVDGVKFFDTTSGGAAISDSTLLGPILDPVAKTNTLLYSRDMTNAAWVKTNVTAALTQTGLDGSANSCSLITATANGATILQTITAAAVAASSGAYVKRSVGTGNIYITRDGGTTWTDITATINSGAFSLAAIENTSVLNPSIGLKFDVSGDAVIVDGWMNHTGAKLSIFPIFTTSVAVTRNADVLTYQTSGNFSDTAGTCIATVTRNDWSVGNGAVIGKAGSGLATSASNAGVQALDGTNTVNGPAGTMPSKRKIGMRWSGSSLQAFSGGSFGSVGSYDGSFNLSTIAIAPAVECYVRDVAIWPSSLTDGEIISASGTAISATTATLQASAPSAQIVIGRTINAAPGNLSFLGQSGLNVIGRTINGMATSLSFNTQSGQPVKGRFILGEAASLYTNPVQAQVVVGRTINGSDAQISMDTLPGLVMFDRSIRSSVKIKATLASQIIRASI